MDVLGGHDANEISQTGGQELHNFTREESKIVSLIDEKNRMVSIRVWEKEVQELVIRKF